MSAELTITMSLVSDSKRQPRFFDRGQRYVSLRVIHLEDGALTCDTAIESCNSCFKTPAVFRCQNRDPPTHEAPPIRRRAQGPVTRRRHLQHVPLSYQATAIEPRFQCARNTCTVVDRHRHSVASIDANLDQWPLARTTFPKLDKIDVKRFKCLYNNSFQRFVHTTSR